MLKAVAVRVLGKKNAPSTRKSFIDYGDGRWIEVPFIPLFPLWERYGS